MFIDEFSYHRQAPLINDGMAREKNLPATIAQSGSKSLE
jgi:hypothetical protein